MEQRLKAIYQILLNQEIVITSTELAIKIGVSSRTVKNDLVQLGLLIKPYGLAIESKPGKGYMLIKKSPTNLAEIQKRFFSDAPSVNQYYESDRVKYLIYKLITNQGYIKLDQLIDELYISRTTLTSDLNKIKAKLFEFHLTIQAKSNYGICVQGSEINKRLFVASYFYFNEANQRYLASNNQMIQTSKEKAEVEQILLLVQTKLSNFKIECSDYVLQSLAIHLLIAITRIKTENYVDIEPNLQEALKHQNSYLAALQISEGIQEMQRLTYPKAEVIYLAMHIESKKMNVESESNEKNQRETDYLIDEIFQKLLEQYGISLFEQDELRLHLALHIPQLVTRARFGMTLRNPLTFESIRKNIFSAKVTQSASCVIKSHYMLEFDMNEFGYLLLYFNIALRKLEKKCNKDALLISGRGRSETILVYNEIMDNFSFEFRSLKIIEASELVQIDEDNYDFIITTTDIAQSCSLPIVKINDYSDLSNLKRALVTLECFPIQIRNIIKEENIVRNLVGKSKQQLIHQIANHVLENKLVNSQCFHEDQLYALETGNGVLLINDYNNACMKSFVYLGFMKKPFLWNQHKIKIIIFMETNKAERHKLQTLCRIFSMFIQNTSIINQVYENQDRKEIVKVLSQLL